MEAKALSKEEIRTLQNEYELGRKAGRKEVVDAVEEFGVLYGGNPWWDGKLKEWGVLETED